MAGMATNPARTPTATSVNRRHTRTPADVPAGNAVASSLATKGQLYPTGRS